MAKFCPLFSGSKANCTYFSKDGQTVLTDVGASLKATEEALLQIGDSLDRVRAILITHSHSDHVAGLSRIVRKYSMPVLATQTTLQTLWQKNILPPQAGIPIEEGREVAGLRVTPFATSHDCPGSCGYRFELPDGMAVAICTDLGVVTPEVKAAILGCRLVLLESNHDLQMLKNGPYPAPLKLRIASDQGHLSNGACSAQLGGLLESGTTRFILGHLSEQNNLPTLAGQTARSALCDVRAVEGRDYLLKVAAAQNRDVIYL